MRPCFWPPSRESVGEDVEGGFVEEAKPPDHLPPAWSSSLVNIESRDRIVIDAIVAELRDPATTPDRRELLEWHLDAYHQKYAYSWLADFDDTPHREAPHFRPHPSGAGVRE